MHAQATEGATTLVWIDSEEAIIVRWADRATVERVRSEVPGRHQRRRPRPRDGDVRKEDGGAMDARERARREHLRLFVEEVAERVPDDGRRDGGRPGDPARPPGAGDPGRRPAPRPASAASTRRRPSASPSRSWSRGCARSRATRRSGSGCPARTRPAGRYGGPPGGAPAASRAGPCVTGCGSDTARFRARIRTYPLQQGSPDGRTGPGQRAVSTLTRVPDGAILGPLEVPRMAMSAPLAEPSLPRLLSGNPIVPAHPRRERAMQGLRSVHRRLRARRARARRRLGQRDGASPRRPHPPRGMHQLREVRPDVPGRRPHRLRPTQGGLIRNGRSRPSRGSRSPPPRRLAARDRRRGVPHPRPRPDEGQRGDRRGRDRRRVRRLLRLPDHPPGRAPRVDGPAHARGGPRLRPGRERARRDQHGARRRRRRRAGPRVQLLARASASWPRRCPTWPARGCPCVLVNVMRGGPGLGSIGAAQARLLPGDQGPRPRRLPRAGARALVHRRGDRARGRRPSSSRSATGRR